jgi:F-type H+-transporting ATPase subunit delta
MATVASTYARAFADVVTEQRLDATRTLKEAEEIAALVRNHPALREVWHAPSIPAEEKRAVLDQIVARTGISRVVRNFVAVLIDKRRTSFLDEIVRQFRKEMNQRLGFAEAEITTARTLTEEERRRIEQDLARVVGKQIRARYQENRALLGGAVARVGSTVYDGSVRGQLERMRQQLTSA